MSEDSQIISRSPQGGRRGRRPYDREQIYRYLWSLRDARGIISKSQSDIAKDLGIGYQRISEIFKDFTTTGHMRKHGKLFEIRFHPDHLDWGDKFNAVHEELRKSHQNKSRREQYDPNYIKGE